MAAEVAVQTPSASREALHRKKLGKFGDIKRLTRELYR